MVAIFGSAPFTPTLARRNVSNNQTFEASEIRPIVLWRIHFHKTTEQRVTDSGIRPIVSWTSNLRVTDSQGRPIAGPLRAQTIDPARKVRDHEDARATPRLAHRTLERIDVSC
jgi:hypothetical protein